MLGRSYDAFAVPANARKLFALVGKSLLLTAVSFSLFSCAGSKTINQSADADGVPLWVSEGSNILTSKQGRRFHGVGSAPALGDFSLQTSTADKRARQEIARILSSFVEIVSRDFIATGDAAQEGFTEQTVARQMDHVSSIDLTGIEVVGHWQDKRSKVVYSIATLNMQQMKEVINKAAELNPGLRHFIRRKGDSIFDRIATAEE